MSKETELRPYFEGLAQFECLDCGFRNIVLGDAVDFWFDPDLILNPDPREAVEIGCEHCNEGRHFAFRAEDGTVRLRLWQAGDDERADEFVRNHWKHNRA